MGYKRGVGPWDLLGVHDLGPIWVPFGAHLLGALGALGPIWGGASGRPKADIMEAEGRLNGVWGRSPQEFGAHLGPIGAPFVTCVC